MRNHIQAVLLLALLAAVLCDIAVHSRPVLAQGPGAGSGTVYIDRTTHHFLPKAHQEVTVTGSQVLGLSCEGDYCYVLSK